MNRRTFIVAGVGGAAILTGCATTGSNNEPQATSSTASTESSKPSTSTNSNKLNNQITINISKRRVSPGDTGTITVIAKDIKEMQARPAAKPIVLEYENASFSPQVNMIAESMPPSWVWSSPQPKATAEIPFHVSADAQSGTYNRTIATWNDSSSYTDSITKKFTITVESGESTSSSTSVDTSYSTTEEPQPTTLCFKTPFTRGTAVYEGTRIPCDDTNRTSGTRTQ